MKDIHRHSLVLSVYATSRGFAFVVFEGHLSPFDWGVKEEKGKGKRQRCLRKLERIFDRYQPEALTIQDTTPQGTERSKPITHFNAAIVELAANRGTPVFAYSRATVQTEFAYLGLPNKQSMAEVIAKHIPAFERYVPPPRKAWMSEDSRMGIFDAAALGLVFFQKAGTDLLGAAAMAVAATR
jgi:Holliday junction resolvasome RuvABC endonuclease subunit